MTFAVPARRAILAALAAVVLTGTAAHAGAIPFESNGRTADVRHDDLDLSKPADQRRLNTRIRRAAARVCPALTVRETRACQTVAMNHVREPIAAAIAKAQGQGASQLAEASKDKVPVPGN